MTKKLYLETFGCQMNVLDSELVLSQLRAHGYELIEERERADVVLFNTCSVREHAEQKVWSRLGELRLEKQDRPDLVVGVIGCMAEREGTSIFQRHPHIDILCGPGELDKLPGMVNNAVLQKSDKATKRQSDAGIMPSSSNQQPATSNSSLATRNSQLATSPKRQVALMGSTTRRSATLAAAQDTLENLDLSRAVSPGDDVSQAYVRITRGCNKFCTYCVVPYTRGPEVHRPPHHIVEEVKMLVGAGAREVTLLGQTVNHYHFKHSDGRDTTFADLLYRVHEAVPDLPRLRFVTSFPRDFTDAALQAMRDCPRICRYLHVPAQSGSDRILKAMNRGYTAGQYLDFIARAKEMMSDISLASDFIVGFPTETEEDHQQSLEIIRHCRFKNSFIFKYSPRPGTTAIDRFTDDVSEEDKRRRNNEMLAVQGEVSAQNNREMVGRTVEVMIEGVSKLVSRQSKSASSFVQIGGPVQRSGSRDDARIEQVQLVGRTRGDQVVVFDGDPSLKGSIVQVRIVDARQMTLFGEVDR